MIFQDIVFTWRDREYRIVAKDVLKAIARVEEVVTFHELSVFYERKTVPVAKVSLAFSEMLNQAGAKVSPEEVYSELFNGVTADQMLGPCMALLNMMQPPEDDAGKEGTKAGKSEGAASSCAPSTSPPSATDG